MKLCGISKPLIAKFTKLNRSQHAAYHIIRAARQFANQQLLNAELLMEINRAKTRVA
jgi:hypothetical protein